MKKLLLTIELVPETAWFSNVRSMISKSDWDKLRKEIHKKANYKCEICGENDKNRSLECHEVWEYDDKNYIQKLIRLVCLCKNCHRVKHIGFAYVKGDGKLAEKHLARINSWNQKEVEAYIDKQFDAWKRRSKFGWLIDLSWLDKKEIEYEDDREIKPERPYPNYSKRLNK